MQCEDSGARFMSTAASDRPQHRGGGDDDRRTSCQTSDAKASGDDNGNQESLKKQPWFWPHMTRDEAQRRLAGQPDGTFLVRECSVPGDFTLTVRKAGANRCVRIYRHESGFSLSAEEGVAPFPSVPELVEFYRHRSLAAFNRRLDLCLSQPLTKPASGGSNQYGLFKELYDLSQDQLSAHTRLAVLQQQRGQLQQKFKLLELMVPALRVVQQMYYDSMQQQQQQEEMPETPAPSEGEGGRMELSGEGEERSDVPADVADSDDGESEGKEFRLSRDEEKSVTANARLLLSRHSAMSEKLHGLKSNSDVVWARLQDLDRELQQVEHLALHIKRRQEELSRQLTTMGCEKQYLSQVLEAGVSTPEFDRSTWLRECSREEALALLEGLPHGAFLIRHKDKRHLPYVLSVVVSAEGEPRTVQHCYIVRPHGRGYGFNPALAVFESIDQLVLRHRHVSLRHYFRHLDVALTFPVGCQELLHRSVSESEEESVAGEGYANAVVIRDVMENCGVHKASEASERSRPSSEPQDCVKDEKQRVADVSSENTCSSNVVSAVKSAQEREYESVDPPRRQAVMSAAIPDVRREHEYESVNQPIKTASVARSKSSPKSTKVRKCKPPKTAGVSAPVKEHTYECVGSSSPRSYCSSSRGNQQTVREPHYEDVGPPAERESATTTYHEDCAKDHKYETLSSADRTACSTLDGQQHEEHVYEDVVNPVRHTTV